MRTKVFLIRHGQTEWNRTGRYMGSSDISLNSTGETQAQRVRRKFKNELIDIVYSSNKKRSRRFAKIVFGGASVEPALREMCFGIFEGLTHEEAIKRHGPLYKNWIDDPLGVTVPAGEGFLKFKRRVVRAFEGITKAYKGKSVAIVTHGGPIAAILCHILGADDFWKKIPPEASITIVEIEGRRKWVR